MNKHVETLQAELAGGEPQLEKLLQELHRLDRYAQRMQLINNKDSMLEHLVREGQVEEPAVENEGQSHPGSQQLTTALAEIIDSLEQHVAWVMQAMNRWCLSVLSWEVGLLLVIAGLLIGLAALLSNGQPLPVLQGWWNELLARPVSLSVYSILLFSGAALVHFKLRKIVAHRIADRLEQMEPFNTTQAFLRNTRIWHSIYRPQPVGWVNRAQRQVNELRKQLTDQVVHPRDVEAA